MTGSFRRLVPALEELRRELRNYPGPPVDISLSELALETFFPADALTGAVLRSLAQSWGAPSVPARPTPPLPAPE